MTDETLDQQSQQPEPLRTFGGIVPQTLSSGPSQPVSLEDPEPQENLISLDDDSSKAPLRGELGDQRALKAHVAMGQDSPGVDILKNQIKSGQEDSLRDSIASLKDSKDDAARTGVVLDRASQGGDITDTDVSFIKNVVNNKTKADPNTVLEFEYAHQFANSVINNSSPSGVLSSALNTNPDRVADSASKMTDLVGRQEIVKTMSEDLDARLNNQSFLGKAMDVATSLVPGYDWYTTYGVVPSTPGLKGVPYLKGDSLQEQYANLYAMSPSDMYTSLKAAVDDIASNNPHLAKQFLDGMVTYTKSDKFLDSLGGAIDVATVLPIGEFAKAVKGAAGVAKATGVAADVSKVATDLPGAVNGALRDVVKANASPVTDIPNLLTASGDIEKAAAANVTKRVSEILSPNDPLKEAGSLNQYFDRRVSPLFNPKGVVEGAADSFSAERTDRLLQDLQTSANKLVSATQDTSKIARSNEASLSAQIADAQKRITDQYTHINNAVLRYSFVRPEESAANVGAVVAEIGKPDATLFDNVRQAYHYAVEHYKLNPGDFNVGRQGEGYYVTVARHLDETSEASRALIATGDNATQRSLANRFLGFARSADDKVSLFQNEQRKATITGASKLNDTMAKIANEAVSPLSKNERQSLLRVMEKDRTDVDPITGKQGKFNDTIADLNEAYQRIHSRNPSYNEAKAYFTLRQFNDTDWLMRNQGVFRDRSRLGIMNIRLKDTSMSDEGVRVYHQSREFGGKFVDNVPFNEPSDAGVIFHTNGTEPKFFRKNAMGDEEKNLLQELKAQNYKIIQVEDPNRQVFGERFGKEPVSFIVTKDFETRKLDWDQLKSYRPGWHSEYPSEWFVKQPQIDKIGDGHLERNVYQGDKVAFGFNTEAEARLYAQRMDTARVMMNRSDPAIADYLSKNLPYTEAEFRQLFREGKEGESTFSSEHPFLHTFNGKTTVDQHGTDLTSRYAGFEDNIRSPYNLMSSVDKKYLGERDTGLNTVEQKGTEANPVFNLKMADKIDPFMALSRGMANVTRSKFFTDYKIQGVESWMKEFGHLLDVHPSEIKNNPVDVLQRATFKNDPSVASEVSAAKLAKSALLQLVGTRTDFQIAMDSVRHDLLSSVFNNFGQGISNSLANTVLNSEVDPLRWMRHVAFNLQIGLFNPIHMFQNAMTSANILGVSGPQHALPGFAAAQMFNMMRFGEQHIDKLAEIAGRMGYKPEWFKEAYAEMKLSGINVIGGEHAWKDDFANPKFFTSDAGRALDKSAILFHEGERFTRLNAYATAFKEFRTSNPDAALTAAARNKILNRADLLSGNMTRASIASWQNGVFSVPGQFLGYMARLNEQILSKRLTPVEKARVLATNTLLYGVPVGTAGTLVGSVWNPHKDIEDYLTDKGIQFKDGAGAAFMTGLMGFVSRTLIGHDTTTGERVGPGGNTVFRDILANDEPFKKILLGASGSKLGDIIKTADPFLHWVMNPFREDSEKVPLTTQDFIDVARNVASVDHAMKVYYAITAGKYFAKTGTYVDDKTTTPQAMWEAITGGTSKDIEKVYSMNEITKNRSQAQQDVISRAARSYRLGIEALSDNNQKDADIYMQQASAYITLGDFRPEEKARVWQEVAKGVNPLTTSVPFDFVFKSAGPSVAQKRMDTFFGDK